MEIFDLQNIKGDKKYDSVAVVLILVVVSVFRYRIEDICVSHLAGIGVFLNFASKSPILQQQRRL